MILKFVAWIKFRHQNKEKAQRRWEVRSPVLFRLRNDLEILRGWLTEGGKNDLVALWITDSLSYAAFLQYASDLAMPAHEIVDMLRVGRLDVVPAVDALLIRLKQRISDLQSGKV